MIITVTDCGRWKHTFFNRDIINTTFTLFIYLHYLQFLYIEIAVIVNAHHKIINRCWLNNILKYLHSSSVVPILVLLYSIVLVRFNEV